MITKSVTIDSFIKLYFKFNFGSVITALAVTSAPVPDVVGMAMNFTFLLNDVFILLPVAP